MGLTFSMTEGIFIWVDCFAFNLLKIKKKKKILQRIDNYRNTSVNRRPCLVQIDKDLFRKTENLLLLLAITC